MNNPFTKSPFLSSTAGTILNRLLKSYVPKSLDKKSGTALNQRSNVTTENGKKLFAKHHTFIFKDQDFELLKHEGYVLSLINQSPKKSTVLIPEFISFKTTNNSCILVTKFLHGEKLTSFTSNKKIKAVSDALSFLKSSSNDAVVNNSYLPQKTDKFLLITFPIVLIKAALKNPELVKPLLFSSFLFLKNWLPTIPFKKGVVLCHRDLDSDNIKMVDKKVAIFDWENACLGDDLYDLSQIPRVYLTEIPQPMVKRFISSQLVHFSHRHRFLYLSIYGAVQSLALDNKESLDYRESKEYLTTLVKNPYLYFDKESLTLFEILNSILLTLAGRLSQKFIFLKKKSVILCYHDISQSKWRFTTKPQDFDRQIELLKKHYQVVSLPELLQNQANSPYATITFDDGYTSLKEIALPILKKHGFVATAFVLGNKDMANHKELANIIPMLNEDEILSLKRNGWEIGFHTVTHPDLTKITSDQLTNEIIIGKKNLEEKLNFKLNYFAYPKGHFNKLVISLVKQAGFKNAFTVSGGEISLEKRFEITRLPLEGTVTDEEFLGLISPLGMIITGLLMTLLRNKEIILDKLKGRNY